jgi:uncharacterized protein YciI
MRSTCLLALLLLAACAAPTAAPSAASPAGAPALPGAHDYVLMLVRRTDKPSNDAMISSHLSYLLSLARGGKLVMAGPFEEGRPDPTLRSLLVLDAPDIKQGMDLGRGDPAVQFGAFSLEPHLMSCAADLHAMVQRDLAAHDANMLSDDPAFTAGMRVYVIAFAEDAQRAAPRLDRDPHTRLLARFGGDWADRGMWILDVRNLAEAKDLIAGFGDVGPIELDPWHGSKEIAALRP